ncbi:MAG: hypothetical protein GTN45_04310 [Xanthomonadales bacterium]|nr:hypothetical protein [Xanthomonadales bacterium]NIT33255.1 hypothetical protein [Xanthomonadales bacterium]
MKALTAIAIILTATPALADPGHFADERGHTHWLALGSLSLAAVICGVVIWRWYKRRAARLDKTVAEPKA